MGYQLISILNHDGLSRDEVQNQLHQPPKIAMVFPGQGSQALGMLAELACEYRTIFDHVYTVASKALGYDLWVLTQEGPIEVLNKTEFTQPALLAAEVAIYRVWESLDLPKPVVMLGHSLGEYTALVCAGLISFTEAIVLVAARGRSMQLAVSAGEGAMAAVLGAEEAQVVEACAQVELETGQVVMPANWNAPGQVVISGRKMAVQKVLTRLKEQGVKRCVELPVSVPSHCKLMRPAAEDSEFSDLLSELVVAHSNHRHAGLIPVLHNYNADETCNSTDLKQALRCQLYSPVKWVDSVKAAYHNHGARIFIECGPGQVLTALNKRILNTVPAVDTLSLEPLNHPAHFMAWRQEL